MKQSEQAENPKCYACCAALCNSNIGGWGRPFPRQVVPLCRACASVIHGVVVAAIATGPALSRRRIQNIARKALFQHIVMLNHQSRNVALEAAKNITGETSDR